MASTPAMDDADRKLIALLRSDARATHDVLAAEVGLSASTVRRRLDRLIARGVIKRFTIDVDPNVDSVRTEALVTLHFAGAVVPGRLQHTLSQIPEVVEAVTVSGNGDVLARIRARDMAGIEQALERLRRATSVERTTSAIVLSRLLDRDDGSPGLLDEAAGGTLR